MTAAKPLVSKLVETEPHATMSEASSTLLPASAAALSPAVTQPSAGHLHISVQRETTYDLLRPSRRVFDPEEGMLADVVAGRPVFFVVDRTIHQLYGREIDFYAQARLHVAGTLICNSSESGKTLRNVELICEAAHGVGLRRDGIIVAVGGGITLDLAGFAAACFRRGIGYVRVPTTLIGLVDVAVGIKQGVNAFGSKNILGAFYPPLATVLDYGFLETLSLPALSSGFAEILKMAVIRDEALLRLVEQHGRSLIDSGYRHPQTAGRQIAERAELLMAEELAGNLYESCLARLVDFGHTFSPVIETASQYTISHGEAVAIDMLLSTSIAAQRGVCSTSFFDRLVRIVGHLGLPLWPDRMPTVSQLAGSLVAVILHRGGALNLVAPQEAGVATFLQNVSTAEVEIAVRDLKRSAGVHVPGPLKRDTQEIGSHAGFGL
ncbi:MAG: sedoheptulose 7-phosphate cyclase [Janthinobacterium lividum]